MYLLHSVSRSRSGAPLRDMAGRGADLSSRWVALGSKAVSWLNFRFSGVADRVNETEQICSSLFILFHPISSFGVLNWTTQKVGHSLLGHGNPNSHGPSVELAAKGIFEVIATSTVDVSTESEVHLTIAWFDWPCYSSYHSFL